MKKTSKLAAIILAIPLLFSGIQTVSAAEPGEISAKSAVLIEAETGEVLYEMNAQERLACGSVTKLMSILLFMEAIDAGQYGLTDQVTVSEFANSMGGSEIWLEVGEVMSVDDLLKAILIQSANDATVAMAEFTAGSEAAFLDRMNSRAAELGMTDTHYLNTTGFDEEGQYTSARDISLVARELVKHKTVFQYTTVWMDELRGGKTSLTNTNKLLKTYAGMNGLKTGTTDDAGCCFCGTAQRDGMLLISVVLGSASSDARFISSRSLLDYGFASWSVFTPELSTLPLTPVPVAGGLEKTITGSITKAPDAVLVPKGSASKVTYEITMAENVEAPVEQGQTLGTVSVALEGKELCRFSVLADQAVAQITIKSAFSLLWKAFLKA